MEIAASGAGGPRMSPRIRRMTSGAGFSERSRELDHEHRKRLRGPMSLVLSMRMLGATFERLRLGTAPGRTEPVPRPPEGTVSVTFVGHATVMITTPGGRIVIDPLLENSLFGVPRAKAAGIAASDIEDTDLVLVTHAHRDHLSRASLARFPGAAPVVVPPRCERLVRRVGLLTIEELEPGRSFRHADVEVIAVPVRHSGARGFGDYVRRGACGYVVRTPQHSIYVAGDTGYFSGFSEIGRRFQPDVALLPIAGYEPAGFRDEHLSPLDAVYAFEDLGARVLIPTSYGSFPLSYEPLDAPLLWLRQIMRERGIAECGRATPGQAQPIGDRAQNGCVTILDHGDSAHFRKPPPAAAVRP